MDHAYKFGTLVCKHTIRYTEREKYFEGREKAHHKQVEFLRREVERLGEVIHQLGLDLDLETSQASLSSDTDSSHQRLSSNCLRRQIWTPHKTVKKEQITQHVKTHLLPTQPTNYQLIY